MVKLSKDFCSFTNYNDQMWAQYWKVWLAIDFRWLEKIVDFCGLPFLIENSSKGVHIFIYLILWVYIKLFMGIFKPVISFIEIKDAAEKSKYVFKCSEIIIFSSSKPSIILLEFLFSE